MIHLGDTATTMRQFTKADIEKYIDMGGAPITDNSVPEPLIGGMFSYLLGVKVPGPGTMYLKQESQFTQKAFVGDKLTASVAISQLRPEKKLVNLKTICKSSDGKIVCEGSALVYFDRPGWPEPA